MPVAWREQMSVGVQSLDDDHKNLIGIINDFEGATRRGAGQAGDDAVRSILRRLQRYALEHFAREEKLQADAGYDGLAENKAQHALLIRSLNDMIVQYTEDRLGPLAEATDQMTTFLNHWLIDHILKTDLKMRGKVAATQTAARIQA